MRAVLVSFGMICRGWNLAWPTQVRHVISVLVSHGFKVDRFAVSVHPDRDELVDGCTCDHNDAERRFDTVLRVNSSQVDAIINKTCQDHACAFSDTWEYSSQKTHNALRQAYAEQRVSDWLRLQSSYNVAIVSAPDYYLTVDINMTHVWDSIRTKAIVYIDGE